MNKVAKRVIIKEDTGGFCGVQYFTTLFIKKNSISYKERTENHIQSMFYADRIILINIKLNLHYDIDLMN